MNRSQQSQWIDAWGRDDDYSFAPLTLRQIDFVDSLISLAKNQHSSGNESESTVESSEIVHSDLKESTQENDEFSERCRRINVYNTKCTKLAETVHSTIENLRKLESDYSSAVYKTKDFYTDCEHLMQQQDSLAQDLDDIALKLSYFEDMATMSQKFSSPTMLTLNESLVPLLSRLDECIQFMWENSGNYFEAEEYLVKYRQYQNSALSTIQSHVINTLRQTANQVAPENDNVLAPNESVFTLYYGKFQLNASRIKNLMHQIEHRTSQSEQYLQYLDDCHRCYFDIRDSLIGHVLQLALDDMFNTSSRNLCALLRSSTNLYIHICRDEYQLYFQFFTQQDASLGAFLDKLCLTLYDRLRPVIIHLEHLESLCEICTLIKHEFIDDNLQQDELDSFVKVMQLLLEDAQERLVYRFNIYIENNIVNYSPVSGDLAYPEKLQMMKNIAENLTATNNDSVNGTQENSQNVPRTGRVRSDSVSSVISTVSDISFVQGVSVPTERRVSSRSTVDLHGMWYPTVRSTIMCLSKLYRSLDRETFQGMSQEVLLACITSLQSATDQIRQRKSAIDSLLFIIKYLLIIREQIVPFQIDNSIKEVYLDFSKTKSAVFNLLQEKSNLFSLTSNNALLKLMFESTPVVTEKVVDSQKAVDNKIKEKCEEFISFTFDYLITDVKNVIMNFKPDPNLEDRTIEFEQFKASIQSVVDEFSTKRSFIQSSMALYLSNSETEAIIFKQIKTKIHMSYEQMLKILQVKITNQSDRAKLQQLLRILL